MNDRPFINVERLVPKLPPINQQLRLLIDTDFANEIDDMYAVALALALPKRFKIEGFVATHFNNSSPGPKSIERSYELLLDFLQAGGYGGKYPVIKGAPPISYYGYPSEGPGVDFIIEKAHEGDEENPLWVVGLGAATNLASAILKDPAIIPKVRYVFHSRSEYYWPERSRQFNVLGDIHAARTLLKEWVPLVWFDTGTHLKLSMEMDAQYISPQGRLGHYMHEYRKVIPWAECRTQDKGFFDLGDIAWMADPSISCSSEIIYAPTMDPFMFFNHEQSNGKMLRIFDIDNGAVWNLLFNALFDAAKLEIK